MDDMPNGTIGLRASGKLTREDYVEMLEPALREGVRSGGMRLVFVLTDFRGLAPGAWVEDMKTGLRVWIREHAAWKRFALVTDVEWVGRATQVFAWITPGETEVFPLDRLDDAKRWAAEG